MTESGGQQAAKTGRFGDDKDPNVGKDTQFKPGESGNPDGRPAGSHNLSYHIQKMLNDPDFEQKMRDGTIIKGVPIEAILKTAIARGISGQVAWAEWLAKYGYGTKVDITSGGKPIPILGGASVHAATEADDTAEDSQT